LTTEAWLWLVSSVSVAWLLDAVLFHAALSALGAPSRSVFLAARVAHLAPLLLWLVFVHQFFWPKFVTPNETPTAGILALELAALAAAVTLAIRSYPGTHGRRSAGG